MNEKTSKKEQNENLKSSLDNLNENKNKKKIKIKLYRYEKRKKQCTTERVRSTAVSDPTNGNRTCDDRSRNPAFDYAIH